MTPVSMAPAITAAPFSPGSGTLVLRCGSLIDGSSDGASHNVTVVIVDGRISQVGAGARAPRGVPVVDLGEYTCLPGLIDMHTHLVDRPGDTADLSVFYRRTLEDQVAFGRENARVTLMAGFTSVRDVGTYVAWADRALRDEINAGRTIGPRIQAAGFYLTIPGERGPRHQAMPEEYHHGAHAVAARRIPRRPGIGGGADVLKVIASGAVLAFGGVPGDPEMTPEEIAAVVEVAHAAGLRVAAHAHGARSIREAIGAGVDTIEHASLIDDAGIELARERGVALSMDIYNGDYIDTEGRAQGWPEEFLRKNIETTEAQRQGFTRAHRAGVDIVFGTDAAVYPHGLNARQFPIMVERGMSPMEAIQSATSVAARYMGRADQVGRIAPGLYGDVIAVRGDPLVDIRALGDVAVVIKGGLAFKLP
jgi:imidazolonepropionase-like amidohydrolase